MIGIQNIEDIIYSLDETISLSLPKCKEKAMKIEFENSHDGQTVYSGSEPLLPFAVSQLYQASVNKWRRLTAYDDNCKAVYEVTFDIEGSNFDFRPGDTIGIIPHNNESEVLDIINHLSLQDVVDHSYTISIDQKAAKISPHVPVQSTLRHVLTNCVDLRGIVKKLFLLTLSRYTKNEHEKRTMEYLCSKEGSSEYTTHILNKSLSLIDLLKVFKSCQPPVEVILEHLPRLLPRPYSIQNCSYRNPNVLKICFSVMDIGNNRKGLTTGWLEEIILWKSGIEDKIEQLSLQNESKKASIKVPMYIRKNLNNFNLPESTETPLILIGPGTGVSPFIGFLEEREHLLLKDLDGKFGFVWLLFGCRNSELDFIYEAEIKEFVSKCVIDKLSTAFSRCEKAEFRYVQDAIIENGEEITTLIMEGACVYVCGDIKTMATQVKDAILQCLVKYGGKSIEESQKYIFEMQKEKRYVNDIWS